MECVRFYESCALESDLLSCSEWSRIFAPLPVLEGARQAALNRRVIRMRASCRAQCMLEVGLRHCHNGSASLALAAFALRFVAADGSLESGIDGGGLFKEFMCFGLSLIFPPL